MGKSTTSGKLAKKENPMLFGVYTTVGKQDQWNFHKLGRYIIFSRIRTKNRIFSACKHRHCWTPDLPAQDVFKAKEVGF